MGSDGADGVDRETVFSNYQSVRSRKFAVSLICEFVGTMLFSFIGSTVASPILGPFVNGFALATAIYTAANISGGHLNPAVTISALLCGFYPLFHSILYIILQVTGAIFGSLLAAGLVPGLLIGKGADFGIGCFGGGTLAKGLTKGQLFGWEAIMTFFLISCVYACGIAKPGHGSHTPLAVGLVLLCCAGTGGRFTGAALNPARVIGPLAVFHCGKDSAWIYILAQLFAALCACAIFAVVSGFGPLTPFTSMKALGLTWPEAVHMWMTGSPPKRLRTDGDENVTELLQRQEENNRLTAVTEKLKIGDIKDKIPFVGRSKKSGTAAAVEAAEGTV